MNSKLKTFSVSFDEKSFDESRHASFIADYIGTEHYDLKFKGRDCLNIIPHIYDVIDEPFADASLLPTYILSKFTRKYVTVALGGDGGDELFAGYPTHIAHSFADKFYLNLPRLIRKNFLEPIGIRLPTSFNDFSLDFKIKKFISGTDFSPEIRNQIWRGPFTLLQKDLLFLPSTRELDRQNSGLKPLFRNLEELLDKDKLNINTKILFCDMRLYLQDDILTKVDRASMANSLEVRSPLLDNDLVDFVNGLNINLKFKGTQTKLIFKKMLRAYNVLPPQIINRPKKGFGIPVAKWINHELKDTICELLSKENIKKEGIFDYAYIKQVLSEHFSCKKDNRKQIWTLFMFELWRKNFLNWAP
jgi:asparagine synthase (glutamine-hydrolysing)